MAARYSAAVRARPAKRRERQAFRIAEPRATAERKRYPVSTDLGSNNNKDHPQKFEAAHPQAFEKIIENNKQSKREHQLRPTRVAVGDASDCVESRGNED